jgi:hypothetical protein
MPGLLTTEDRLEINDLYSRYGWAFDTANDEAFSQVFAEDAIYDLPRGRRFTGREEIRGYLRGVAPRTVGRQHYAGQILVEGDSDRAVGRAYALGSYQPPDDGDKSLVFLGYYEDVLAKVNGMWFFQHRVFKDWSREEASTPETARVIRRW